MRRTTVVGLCLSVAVVCLTAVLLSGGAVATTDTPAAVDNGTDEYIVLFETADEPTTAEDESFRDARMEHTQRVLEPLESFAERHEGVTVTEQYWLVPGALVEVDASTVDPDQLEAIESVDAVEPNEYVARAPVIEPDPATPAADVDRPEQTYGLERINATAAWEQQDTRGDGAHVAVLDTGVDADHPEIDIATWDDFSDDPAPEPTDYGGHGTHVTGTVVGENASGTQIGVSPDATVSHGAVLTDCTSVTCRGSVSQVVQGIQWAVRIDADVAVMSLGVIEDDDPYVSRLIDFVRDAEEAGTMVVAATGNSGEGTSRSPGNVYESIGVGAINETDGVPAYSGGEHIDTDDAWGISAPVDWPDEYTVPNVVAPGDNVYSTLPDGEYGESSGTSMATPHVGGVAALVQASTDRQLSPAELQLVLSETVDSPADSDDPSPTRYGDGIVDASAATTFATNTSTVAVTDVETSDVPAGENLSISVDLHNHHPLDRLSDVEVTVEDVEQTTQEVLVEGDSSNTLDITVPTSEDDAGTRTVQVDTAGDEQTTTVSLLRPQINVDIEDVTSPVFAGYNNVTATVTASNTGTLVATRELTITEPNGLVDVDESVTLEPGESQSVPIEINTSDRSHGTYTLTADAETASDAVDVKILDPNDAHRFVSDSQPSPGETVHVSMLYHTDQLGGLNVIESFEPSLQTEQADTPKVFVDGERVPLFTDLLNQDNLLVVSDNEFLGPGVIEVEYELQLPDNATSGDAFLFEDSSFEFDEDLIPVRGVDQIVVQEPSVEDYTNSDGVVTSDRLLDAIDDWRTDRIDSELLLAVIDAWRSE